MFSRFVVMSFAIAMMALVGFSEAAQEKKEDKKEEKKKRTGTVTGELQTRKDTPNGKNVIVEVLGAGEEKARPYRVQYDPKVKGPIADVLEKVKAAKIGDRVTLDWIDTGEGLAITAFQVLKKKEEKK